MIGEILTSICVSEFITNLVFESEGNVSAYSKLIFLDDDGNVISEFINGENGSIVIPRALFLGKPIEDTSWSEGQFEMRFPQGAIRIERIGTEPEIGLVAFATLTETLL